jgi:hypothetical protein
MRCKQFTTSHTEEICDLQLTDGRKVDKFKSEVWSISGLGLDYQRKNISLVATLSKPALGRKSHAFQW